MLIEYDEMLGLCSSGDAMDIMKMDGENNASPEILEALSGMDDNDVINDVVEYPEMMGFLIRTIIKRRQMRKKLAKKLKGMPKKKRRRIIARLMAKGRGKAAFMMAPSVVPGSRLFRALILRRASKRGQKRAAARKKRFIARRKARRTARTQKKLTRGVRRQPEPVADTEVIKPGPEPIAPMEPMTAREEKKAQLLQFPASDQEAENGTQENGQEKPGFVKFLPLIAAAAAIPFLLPKKK